MQPIICGGLVILAQEQFENIATGAITDADQKTMQVAATKLLPVLFKLVSESASNSPTNQMDVDDNSVAPGASSQDVQCIIDAISALARLAPEQFLHNLFQKLMHRLLEEVQSESGDKEKICSLLNLSEGIVTSEVLNESSISFLYRAVKPLIRTDEYGARVQKRAYKVLSEICEHHHSFVTDLDRLKELAGLLSGTILTSQVSARYMRLKCLKVIIEGYDESHKEQLVSFARFPRPNACRFSSIT